MSISDPELPDFVTASAPGSINLMHRVTSATSGEYAAITLALSASQFVRAEPRTDTDEITLRYEDDADIRIDETTATAIHKSLADVRATVGRNARGLDLMITSQLPDNGGVGRLQADVAAALMAASVVWDAGLNRDELADIATRHVDRPEVAFMGGAYRHTGDQATPLLMRSPFSAVLLPAINPYDVEAIWTVHRDLSAYAAEVDGVDGSDNVETTTNMAAAEPDVMDRMTTAITTGDAALTAMLMHNDLQTTVTALLPEMADLLDVGMEEGALAAMVASTGPSLVLMARNNHDAAQLASRIQERTEIAALTVQLGGPGATIL